MLQRDRNEQTVRILERLRKQGAPSAGTSIPLDMTLAEQGEEEADDEDGADPAGSTIVDQGMPGSPILNGLADAKKKLKRRY